MQQPETSYPAQGQTYTPPPPEQAYTPPEQAYTPPEQTYTPPPQSYAPPEQAYTPPEYSYPPPGQEYAPAQPAQTYGQYSPEESGAPAGKKKGLWWKIAVPVAVVVIAAAAVYYFVFLRNTANILNNAFTNFGEEITQRIDGTPLKAIGLLSETLKDGTVTVGFDYEDSWSGSETSGKISLSSAYEDREFALAGNVKIFDGYWESEQNVDFEAFMNKERMAFGSKLINNNYYGFRYSTFRDDIEEFGYKANISRDIMDTLSDFVEMLDEAINKTGNEKDSASLDAYSTIIQNFIRTCEQTSERVDFDSGGATVKATRVDIIITKEDILQLLSDLYEQLDRDEELRESFKSLETYGSMYTVGVNYNTLLRELSNAIDELDDNYSGTMTVSFYIGSGDRLLRYEFNTNIRMYGERIRASVSFDFGASVTDRWTMRIDAEGETVRINWDYKERSSSIENTITVSAGSGTVTLMSLYSPARGDFTLSYETKDDYGWSDRGEITGVFTEDSKGFTLSFDNLMGTDNDGILTIEITGEKGANIKQIDYINLDEWDKDLITDIENAFSG